MQCMRVTPRKHNIDIMSQRMSMYRKKQQRGSGQRKTTLRVAAKANRMRVNERPEVFSQKEARTAEKYVPRREGTLRKRRRKQRKATSFEASLGGKDLTLTLRADNRVPFQKGSETTRERERKDQTGKTSSSGRKKTSKHEC